MRARRPVLSLLFLAFAAASFVLGGLACGGKDKKNPVAPVPTTHQFPLSDGRWRCTLVSTATSGGAECSSFNGSQVDTFDVIGGESNFFPGCIFNVTGNRFTQACSDTFFLGSCTLVERISGSGSFSATTFTAVYTFVMGGDCAGVSGCTVRFNLSGQKIASEPGRARLAGPARWSQPGPGWVSRARSR